MKILLYTKDVEDIVRDRLSDAGFEVSEINFRSTTDGIEMSLEIDIPKKVTSPLTYPDGVRTPNWTGPFTPNPGDTFLKGPTCDCGGNCNHDK